MEKEKRKYLLDKGDKNKYSHLIIIIDHSEYIRKQIIRYVKRNENIKDVLFEYISNPNYKIHNIFNYDMDLEKQINENRPYHIVAPYNKMTEAYNFAEKRHKGQIRKNGTPYINHPIQVANLIMKYFNNNKKINELLTAAYLHDVVEDTETTIFEIEEKFGKYVAYLVEGVTSDETIKNKIGKTAYLCNKMLNMEEDILNLKLCDRLANVLDLNNADNLFIERYLTETTIILNYLLENRSLTAVQIEIIKEINKQVNKLRKIKILKLINNNQ